jgi:hypothetical protein
MTLEGCRADPVSSASARLLMRGKCDAGLEARRQTGQAGRHFGREREPCGRRAGASVPGVGAGAQETRPRPEGQPGKTQEDGVSEFEDLEKKAEAYAEEHPEQADKGINEVTGFAERDTDHQHDEQIDRAVDAAERHISRRQDRQGNQD